MRADDQLVGLLSHWLARHVDDADLLAGIERLSGSGALRSAVERGTVDALLVRWRRESAAFERAVESYRLYTR